MVLLEGGCALTFFVEVGHGHLHTAGLVFDRATIILKDMARL